MSKFLDYYGLSYFWNKIDNIKQDKLTIDTELDATSHNPVENMAIKLAIDKMLEDITNDISNPGAYRCILHSGIIHSDIIEQDTNTYNSSIVCFKRNDIITIYFDVETNYGKNELKISNYIPEKWRPYKLIQVLVPGDINIVNSIFINEDGQVTMTSVNGVYNIHTAVTYLLETESTSEDPITPPNPEEEEASKYSTTAKLVKIGNYLPTYDAAENTVGGYKIIGAALTTDASGEMFSGYQGNYIPYVSTDAGLTSAVYNLSSDIFCWNNIHTNEVDENEKGYLHNFEDCYDTQSSSVTEAALIEHGITIVRSLAEDNDEIQYFVTGFGMNPWIGGVNSEYNSEIADKAYGGTSTASYNGRFYWSTTVLSHVFRFVPASLQPVTTDYPVEKNGEIIGYIDKIIPLQLIDTAYDFGGFTIKDGSTWRSPQLISTNKEDTSLDDAFEAHLVVEDWNEEATGGNRYNVSNYYQRVDVLLVEQDGNITQEKLELRNQSHDNLTRSWAVSSSRIPLYTGEEFN